MNRIVNISQIDSHDMLIDYSDAIPVLLWLTQKGYRVQSWEVFVKVKKKIIRTLDFGSPTDTPHRYFGKEAGLIEKEIKKTIEDWTKRAGKSHLLICLNLDREYYPQAVMMPMYSRVTAGLLGLLSSILIGILTFVLLIRKTPFDMGNLKPIFLLSPGVFLLLPAAYTGKGDLELSFLERFLKNRTKKRIQTETGEPRWPEKFIVG